MGRAAPGSLPDTRTDPSARSPGSGCGQVGRNTSPLAGLQSAALSLLPRNCIEIQPVLTEPHYRNDGANDLQASRIGGQNALATLSLTPPAPRPQDPLARRGAPGDNRPPG